MTLDQFLRLHGLSLDGIAAEAVNHLALVQGECLFVAGSLVEGLGTPTSDLDLFLFTDRDDFAFHSMTDIALVMGGCLIDIRVVKYEVVRQLVGRFRDWRSAPRIPRRSFEFTDDERKLMHRVAVGRALFGTDILGDLKDEFESRDLARHKLDWARHLASTTQVDIAGFLAARDAHSAFFATQDLLGLTVDGLLAGFGSTNPNTKWRARLLAGLDRDWEDWIPGRRTGLSAQDCYLALYSRLTDYELRSVHLNALDVAAFSRAVFPWAEMRLLHRGEMVRAPPQSPKFASVPDCALPHLRVDVEMRYVDGGLEVLRLNTPGQVLTFPLAVHRLLACFDGSSGAREAACRVSSGADIDFSTALSSIDELLLSMRAANLEAPEPHDEALLQSVLRAAAQS